MIFKAEHLTRRFVFHCLGRIADIKEYIADDDERITSDSYRKFDAVADLIVRTLRRGTPGLQLCRVSDH